MNINRSLSWLENIRLIQAHYSLSQNDVALLLGVAESTLSWSLHNKPSTELSRKLAEFIRRSDDNWEEPGFWRDHVETIKQFY